MKYIGEYSEEQAKLCGCVIWADTEGKEWWVTEIHLPGDSGSCFPDKKIVSEDLIRFVGRITEGTEKTANKKE